MAIDYTSTAPEQSILTVVLFPNTIEVGYISKANLVTKSQLISAYWPSCCWDHSESRSGCLRTLSFTATTKMETTLRMKFPSTLHGHFEADSHKSYAMYWELDWSMLFQCALSSYVKVNKGPLLSRSYTSCCVSKTSSTSDNHSSLICEQRKQEGVLSLRWSSARKAQRTNDSGTFVNLLFRHRSEIKVLGWSQRYWVLVGHALWGLTS